MGIIIQFGKLDKEQMEEEQMMKAPAQMKRI
jgi:hypothetical protein